MIKEFVVGSLYSNEEIFKTLHVANAGGIRLSTKEGVVFKAAIMTSVQDFNLSGENPYHDRLENDILTYTAAGKLGEQTLAGINNRVIEQKESDFPIHGFVLVASRRDKTVGPKRWRYLGLLEYLKHYPDTQLDSNGKIRRVWIFEFKIHQSVGIIPIEMDRLISERLLSESKHFHPDNSDNEIIESIDLDQVNNLEEVEKIRSQLLVMEPRKFEFFIKDLLIHTGFIEVCVTKFSADGGVDVNARTGEKIWIFENSSIQVQAKRWLHSVGRKEVAELRGSLQPFARGVVITTSHFSKAAINEAIEEGKNPISLIDGFRLSKVVVTEKFTLNI